ncbi:MAG: LacI family DNA-binding transcriptional regulator [Prolixibacteraceae bacterium]
MNKGKKVITIYDIAEALNLSPSTVSRGLKDHPLLKKETIRKIKTAAIKLGYRRNKFASNLRQKQSFTIGVLVPKLNSYFMSSVISGIEKITNQNEYGLLINQSQESVGQEISCVKTLFDSHIDGLLVSLAYDTKDLDHFSCMMEKNIPIVFFDRVTNCVGCMSIVIDNYKAGYEATTHLIEQGCSNIIHLTGNLLRNVYADRLHGYSQALTDHGITFDQNRVIAGDLSGNGAKTIVQKLLQMKPRPDAIFAANDTSAVSIMLELIQAGIKIPEEISVVGFNNDPISRVITPQLTTIDYPAIEMGELAATSLINKLKSTQTNSISSMVLQHSLIVRDSSLKNKPKN